MAQYWDHMAQEKKEWLENQKSSLSLLYLGYYAYIETSAPRRPGDNAIMTSPKLQSFTGSKCLTFYYHMNGTHVGQLNVYMVVNGHQTTTPIFSQHGNMGMYWIQGAVTIPAQGSFWQVTELNPPQSSICCCFLVSCQLQLLLLIFCLWLMLLWVTIKPEALWDVAFTSHPASMLYPCHSGSLILYFSGLF